MYTDYKQDLKTKKQWIRYEMETKIKELSLYDKINLT